jgi:SPP1 family predicted phage head-tail adaptor
MAQAAAFREWVTIFSPAPSVDDGLGGRVTAGPAPTLETWASVQQLQAKVFFENGKTYIKQPYRITIRYVNDPTVEFTNRVEWNGVRITVASVVTDAKKTVTTIYGFGN